MSDTKKVRDTDDGTDFRVLMKTVDDNDVQAVFDISTMTTLEIEFLDPDGATVTAQTASFVTDGTDGLIKFVNPDTTMLLNKPGVWHRRGHVAKTGEDWRNYNWIPFTVLTSVQH